MYPFIEHHKHEFGLRWLCRRFQVSSSAYYNDLKRRKRKHEARKAMTQRVIVSGFHQSNGTMVCKMMRDYCELQGLKYSLPTICKYMKELN